MRASAGDRLEVTLEACGSEGSSPTLSLRGRVGEEPFAYTYDG